MWHSYCSLLISRSTVLKKKQQVKSKGMENEQLVKTKGSYEFIVATNVQTEREILNVEEETPALHVIMEKVSWG